MLSLMATNGLERGKDGLLVYAMCEIPNNVILIDAFAQLFAPAEEEFVCFEPMTAASNALNSGDGLEILAPGEECRTEFAISILDRSPAAQA